MPETIRDGVVVTFDYAIRDLEGATLDASSAEEPGVYLHGAANIAPGLEAALTGRKVGDNVTVEIPPEQGFGSHDGQTTLSVSRDAFEPGVEITLGMQCSAEEADDLHAALWVVAVTDEVVTLDTNHPLAGKVVVYEVTITGLREATPGELAQGAPA